MRVIALDVHRSFAQVAELEGGVVRQRGRVDLIRDKVLEFAATLRPDDEVVLEATGNTMAIVRLLKPYVARVVIANPLQVRVIAEAKAKTDADKQAAADAKAAAAQARADAQAAAAQARADADNPWNRAIHSATTSATRSAGTVIAREVTKAAFGKSGGIAGGVLGGLVRGVLGGLFRGR